MSDRKRDRFARFMGEVLEAVGEELEKDNERRKLAEEIVRAQERRARFHSSPVVVVRPSTSPIGFGRKGSYRDHSNGVYIDWED